MSESAPTYANEDVHDQLREERQRQQAEKEEQAKQAQSLKRRLQQKRQERTVTVDIDGVPVDFAPMDGKDADWMESLGERYADLEGVDEEELEGEQLKQFRKDNERLSEMLAKYAKDGELDKAFWSETYTSDERQMFVVDLRRSAVDVEEGN